MNGNETNKNTVPQDKQNCASKIENCESSSDVEKTHELIKDKILTKNKSSAKKINSPAKKLNSPDALQEKMVKLEKN